MFTNLPKIAEHVRTARALVNPELIPVSASPGPPDPAIRPLVLDGELFNFEEELNGTFGVMSSDLVSTSSRLRSATPQDSNVELPSLTLAHLFSSHSDLYYNQNISPPSGTISSTALSSLTTQATPASSHGSNTTFIFPSPHIDMNPTTAPADWQPFEPLAAAMPPPIHRHAITPSLQTDAQVALPAVLTLPADPPTFAAPTFPLPPGDPFLAFTSTPIHRHAITPSLQTDTQIALPAVLTLPADLPTFAAPTFPLPPGDPFPAFTSTQQAPTEPTPQAQPAQQPSLTAPPAPIHSDVDKSAPAATKTRQQKPCRSKKKLVALPNNGPVPGGRPRRTVNRPRRPDE